MRRGMMKKRYVIFILSLFINALGNAFMLKGSVGSAPWTACFDNFSNFFHITPGTACIILSLVFYVISKLIGRDLKLSESIICVVSSSVYGLITDFYLLIIGREQTTSIFMNYFYGIFGVILVAIAVSMAIQANIGYLALDDFLKNIKTHVCKGNISVASIFSSIIALAISGITGYLSGGIVNITILTIFIGLFLGILVSFFDKIIIIKFKDEHVNDI